MPRKTPPKYRRQKRKKGDLAFVEIAGEKHYLGPYDSPQSRTAYARILSELASRGGHFETRPEEITIIELAAQYWTFAQTYYSDAQGNTTSEPDCMRYALRPLLKLYGHDPAQSFGPKKLKTVRQYMIDLRWCRTNINRRVSAIKRLFAWGVSEELLPPGTIQALRALPGLKHGRTEAKESDPVKPVPDGVVDATLAHCTPILRGMVTFHRYTGARPGEVCILRTGDLNMDGRVWIYKPAHHKTEYRGRERLIFVGPQAQEAVRPFLRRNLEEYLFSPTRAEQERRAIMHEARKTPLGYGNGIGTNRKRFPQWEPGDRYDVNSYRRAITYACARAFPAPDDVKGEALIAWRKDHTWSPSQIRHLFATRVRRDYGLASAQVLLGHAMADVTQVYAERDTALAIRVAQNIG